MKEEFLKKLKTLPKIRLFILVLTVWQYLSIVMIAVLNWPNSLVWLNLGLLLLFVLFSPVYESLLMLILSIPFYVVLPNGRFNSLSMWRVLYGVLLAVWLIKDKKILSRLFRPSELKTAFLPGLRDFLKSINFLPWDKYLAAFVLLAVLVTWAFGRFRLEGFKEIFFWVNVYFLYVVLINVLKSKEQIFEFIRYVIWALAIIVALGFTQLIGTFLANLDTFWVYWASNVAQLYYGSYFASVALYSNSWFSYTGGRELRMFSIMPDSQSFAYICVMALCMGTALTGNVFKHIRKWLWSGIRFAGLALILSGTRAVWVGMALPLGVVVFGYFKNVQKHLSKKFLWPFVIILALFLVSPLINKGLGYLRFGGKFQENFLARAQSIYDLNEISNQGRLAIWKSTALFALKHPFGVGVSNFIVSLGPGFGKTSYDQLSNQVNKRYNLPNKYISAHNLYLQILVETGVAGFLIFCGFFLRVIFYFWDYVRHCEKSEDFLVYFVAQALLLVLWILAAAFFDVTLFNDKVLMFFLIDIGLAGLVVQRHRSREIKD